MCIDSKDMKILSQQWKKLKEEIAKTSCKGAEKTLAGARKEWY